MKRATASESPRVLIGTPNPKFAQQANRAIQPLVYPASVRCATTLERLRELARDRAPETIMLDGRIVGSRPLTEPVTEFAAIAPVILVAPYEREPEVSRLAAAGQVEFVPPAKHWPYLAAALAERSLRRPESRKILVAIPDGFREDFGEVFRREINNPLTGMLGNAELLLAHSDRLPSADIQRIRTIVRLAVRLT